MYELIEVNAKKLAQVTSEEHGTCLTIYSDGVHFDGIHVGDKKIIQQMFEAFLRKENSDHPVSKVLREVIYDLFAKGIINIE